MFFDQLAGQIGTLVKVFHRCGEDMLFFGLEVLS